MASKSLSPRVLPAIAVFAICLLGVGSYFWNRSMEVGSRQESALRSYTVDATPPMARSGDTEFFPRPSDGDIDNWVRPGDLARGNESFPEFPIPPPEPYRQYDLTENVWKVLMGRHPWPGPSIDYVDGILRDVLTNNGYGEDFKYYVPSRGNGFVLVTRIEQIDNEGHPSIENRWVKKLVPIKYSTFSLAKYRDALVGQPAAYFRLFVFIVSDANLRAHGHLSWTMANDWEREGLDKLPPEIGRQSLSRQMEVHALVYVFETHSKEGEPKSIESEANGETHVRNANFIATLTKFENDKREKQP